MIVDCMDVMAISSTMMRQKKGRRRKMQIDNSFDDLEETILY